MSELVVEDGSKRQHRQRLKGLLAESGGAVRIASAYVTDTDLLIGVKNGNIHLMTSLLPMDIASGATSLETLRELIGSGVKCRFLPERPRLHAKVYIFGDTSAVVTSANLTASGFDSNIEVGVELRGQDVHSLTTWFDELWAKAQSLSLLDLAALRQQTAAMRRAYITLKRKTISRLTLPENALASGVFSDELRDLLENSNRFYVCNTDRRQGERTTTGGYVLEEEE